MTKEFKKLFIISILLIAVATLAGCNNNSKIDRADETGISSKPTSFYSINEKGEKTYYQQQYPEVVGVRNVITDFCKAVDNRSYKTITGTEEYNYYTKELADSLVKEGDIDATVNAYKKSSRETLYSNTIFNEISFDKDLKECTVSVSDQLKIVGADKEYLDKHKFEIGSTYGHDINFKLIKVDGSWKIKGVTAEANYKKVN